MTPFCRRNVSIQIVVSVVFLELDLNLGILASDPSLITPNMQGVIPPPDAFPFV